MNPDTVVLIQQIADSLKIGVEHIYAVYVRQAQITAYISLAQTVAGVILIALSGFAAWRLYKFAYNRALRNFEKRHAEWTKNKREGRYYSSFEPNMDTDDIHFATAMGTVVIIGCVSVIGGLIIVEFDLVAKFMNPEYYAIQTLLSQLRPR